MGIVAAFFPRLKCGWQGFVGGKQTSSVRILLTPAPPLVVCASAFLKNAGQQSHANRCLLERLKPCASATSAWVAQLVEHVLGKDEVAGSIPVPGSTFRSNRFPNNITIINPLT